MRIVTAWKMVSREKTRFAVTVGGVGFTVILMLFQFGVYQGAKRGATGYVKGSPAEIWMCEANSNNLIRSSSFLQSSVGEKIKAVEGVGAITGILRVLTTTRMKGRSVSFLLFGYDPNSQLAHPFPVSMGTSDIGAGEIVVDKAFALKHKLALGDSLKVKGQTFRVSGICEGANAIAAQFVFVHLEDAQRLLGLSDVVSFYLLQGDGRTNKKELIQSLKRFFPSLAVFSKEIFIHNNIIEMKSGVLPVLWIIALFGGILGMAIITLMLYGSVIEKRESFALLKAVGASHEYLIFLVLKQSVASAVSGFLFGFVMYRLLTPLIIRLVPEISLGFVWEDVVGIFAVSILIGTGGSLVPVHKMLKIYPMEVFKQ